MLHWCNEVIGANEAEDLLTANSPINHPALFEDKHTLATGTNSGKRLTGRQGTTQALLCIHATLHS